MGPSNIALIAYVAVGMVCGLATAVGFLLQEIRHKHIEGTSVLRSALWIASMAIVVMPVGVVPVLLAFGFVLAKGVDEPFAWVRLTAYVIGVVIGLAASAGAAFLAFNVDDPKKRDADRWGQSH